MSWGLATEAGCEVHMKEDTLMLIDRQGERMIQTTRSKNRLYKVTLQADQLQCLKISSTTNDSMWHARLGHIGRDSMSTMIKKELATGITKMKVEKEMCSSCLLGKQLRHMFP